MKQTFLMKLLLLCTRLKAGPMTWFELASMETNGGAWTCSTSGSSRGSSLDFVRWKGLQNRITCRRCMIRISHYVSINKNLMMQFGNPKKLIKFFISLHFCAYILAVTLEAYRWELLPLHRPPGAQMGAPPSHQSSHTPRNTHTHTAHLHTLGDILMRMHH